MVKKNLSLHVAALAAQAAADSAANVVAAWAAEAAQAAADSEADHAVAAATVAAAAVTKF